MAITESNLISFIKHNFKEFKSSGCADYRRRYGSMTLAEINACENALAPLIHGNHTEVTYKPEDWDKEQVARK